MTHVSLSNDAAISPGQTALVWSLLVNRGLLGGNRADADGGKESDGVQFEEIKIEIVGLGKGCLIRVRRVEWICVVRRCLERAWFGSI